MDTATNANDNNKPAQVGQTQTQPPHPRPQLSTAIQLARLAAAVTIAPLPSAIKSLSSKYHQQFLQLHIDPASWNLPNPDWPGTILNPI
jgi:hypothetical protein